MHITWDIRLAYSWPHQGESVHQPCCGMGSIGAAIRIQTFKQMHLRAGMIALMCAYACGHDCTCVHTCVQACLHSRVHICAGTKAMCACTRRHDCAHVCIYLRARLRLCVHTCMQASLCSCAFTYGHDGAYVALGLVGMRIIGQPLATIR